MKKVLRPLQGILSLCLLFPTIMLLNVIQASSILLLPISSKLVREINRVCCGAWFALLNFCVKRILRIEVVHTGTPLPFNENIFLLANHQAMTDIPALIAIACECQRQQDLKWFVKDPIKWVPGIGWGMLFLDCLFVKRNWMADKEKVTRIFSRLKNNNVPFWIVSFLEGTRATPAKMKRSQDFAKKANLPVLNNVMLPRTKGFEATLDGLDKIEAIYDATIGYEDFVPGLAALFFQPIKRIHVHVVRYPISSVPREDRATWVVERYVEKDILLEKFKTLGHF